MKNIALNKEAFKTKEQLNRYCTMITAKMKASEQRIVKEISFGIIAAGSSQLSDIARSLNEERTIASVENRLSENLKRKDMTDELETRVMKKLKPEITKKHVIAIDGSDIIKPRARKMEGLAKVHDGSTHEIENGYPTLTAALVNLTRDKVSSITTRLYSRKEKGFVSDNDEFEKLSKKIINQCGNTATYALDRGFCSKDRLKYLESEGIRFVIRATERTITTNAGKNLSLTKWAKRQSLPYSIELRRIRDGVEERKRAWYTANTILIDGTKYRVVVMEIEGHDICVFISNLAIGNKKWATFGAEIIRTYGCRWSVEEKIRFEKSSFGLENIRLHKLRQLKNFVAIMNIASTFVAHLGFFRVKLKVMARKVREVGKAFRSDVRFIHYQIIQGLRELWLKSREPAFHFKRKHIPDLSPFPLFELEGV